MTVGATTKLNTRMIGAPKKGSPNISLRPKYAFDAHATEKKPSNGINCLTIASSLN
jgi:hypothetical protein